MIALLTDFGTADPYVSSMKASIFKLAPDANVLDIHHEIEPQNIMQACFDLQLCVNDMPHGCIFVVVVDPGVGSHRRGLLLETENYCFIGPDNGVFSSVLPLVKDCFEINYDHEFFAKRSQTFHGRDVFAPLAAQKLLGNDKDLLLPMQKEKVHQMDGIKAEIKDRIISGTIIKKDHFGNLMTNLHHRDLKNKLEIKECKIADQIIDVQFVENYSQLQDSQIGVLWGSSGYLEFTLKNSSIYETFNRAIPMGFELLRSL